MSGRYPEYPGELPDAGTAPAQHPRPPAQQHPVPQPAPQHPPVQQRPAWQGQGQGMTAPRWQPPPPPPRPERLPDRPATLTWAARLMVLAALVYVAYVVAFIAGVDTFREFLREDIASTEPSFTGPEAEAFLDVMVGVLVAFAVGWALVQVGLWLWLARKSSQGRNWARITATVVAGLAVTAMLYGAGASVLSRVAPDVVGGQPGLDPASVSLSVLHGIVGAVVVVLLWRRATSDYVKALAAESRWQEWSRRHGPPPPIGGSGPAGPAGPAQ